MPRPAYMAAVSPAGPAPTMIRSWSGSPRSFLATRSAVSRSVLLGSFSFIAPEFQSREIALPRQSPCEARAEMHGFELHVRALRAAELVECRPTHHHHAVAVAALPVQQRRRRLDQTLPRRRRVVANNRTPDGFQGLVGGPIIAGVE